MTFTPGTFTSSFDGEVFQFRQPVEMNANVQVALSGDQMNLSFLCASAAWRETLQ